MVCHSRSLQSINKTARYETSDNCESGVGQGAVIKSNILIVREAESNQRLYNQYGSVPGAYNMGCNHREPVPSVMLTEDSHRRPFQTGS